jgi:hypothetical protein
MAGDNAGGGALHVADIVSSAIATIISARCDRGM